MRAGRVILPLLLAAAPALAGAQTAGRDDTKSPIIVTGQRPDGTVAMSDWQIAEAEHVVLFGKGDPARLARIARNLEALHFLLSVLLNRVDAPDETVKLSVTLIGDAAEFRQLGLRDVRWQEGPFPGRVFPRESHYDPRDDGAVLATTRMDQKIVLQQGIALASLGSISPVATPGSLTPSPSGEMSNSLAGPSGAVEATQANEISFARTAEGRLYAGYARHYLLTYFPAAYPRWYLDGFAEIFSTVRLPAPGVIEYGHAPPGFRDVMERSGRYPVRDVLSGRYLTDKRHSPAWTPYRAWAMAHLLFFSEEWKAPLHAYLAAVARGASPEEAAAALGEEDKLQQALSGYQGSKVPFERMTFPTERVGEALVRRLTEEEAEFVRRRLVLGDRVAPPAERGGWLQDLRAEATRSPTSLPAQLLLAEAACRTGAHDECLAAADRALQIAPNDLTALSWHGLALVGQAAAAPASQRQPLLRKARAAIVKANRADPEQVLPLLAYYRSFADVGEAPSDVAVQGLMKASESVPPAPSTRLMLGETLVRRGDAAAARRVLRPVAYGAYESPEKAKARALLESLPR